MSYEIRAGSYLDLRGNIHEKMIDFNMQLQHLPNKKVVLTVIVVRIQDSKLKLEKFERLKIASYLTKATFQLFYSVFELLFLTERTCFLFFTDVRWLSSEMGVLKVTFETSHQDFAKFLSLFFLKELPRVVPDYLCFSFLHENYSHYEAYDRV